VYGRTEYLHHRSEALKCLDMDAGSGDNQEAYRREAGMTRALRRLSTATVFAAALALTSACEESTDAGDGEWRMAISQRSRSGVDLEAVRITAPLVENQRV
jgi:hypothetical protein